MRQAITAALDLKDTNRVINDDDRDFDPPFNALDFLEDLKTHPSGECSNPRGVSVREWDIVIAYGYGWIERPCDYINTPKRR